MIFAACTYNKSHLPAIAKINNISLRVWEICFGKDFDLDINRSHGSVSNNGKALVLVSKIILARKAIHLRNIRLTTLTM